MATTENKKSAAVTTADAQIAGTGSEMVKSGVSGGVVKIWCDTVELADNMDVGSTYRLARVPSRGTIVWIKIFCDTLTGAAADIGLYQTPENGGAVVDADCYATALSLATAINTSNANQAFEARNVDAIANAIWQDAGLSADPGVMYDLTMTLTAQVTDPGTLSAHVYYTDGN